LKYLTVNDLRLALDELVKIKPEHGELLVNLLDMADRDAPETAETGLLTTVETDIFDEDQGLVLSLVADVR
jgi:hypothetical protein